MDTIFYLYILKKEQTCNPGGADQIPPVFTLRRQEREGYRVIFVGLPSVLLNQAQGRLDGQVEGLAQDSPPGSRYGSREGNGRWRLLYKRFSQGCLKPAKKAWLEWRGRREKQRLEQEGQRPEQERQGLWQEGQRPGQKKQGLWQEGQRPGQKKQGLWQEGQRPGQKKQGLEQEGQRPEQEKQGLGQKKQGLWQEGQRLRQERQGLGQKKQGLEQEGQRLRQERQGLGQKKQGLWQEGQRLGQKKQRPGQEKQRLEREMRRTAWILELMAYLRPYVEEFPACYSVCEETVVKWLKKEELCGWWQEHWTICGFDGFHQRCFAEELLKQVHLAHYLILGFDDYIPELLRARACHMKSLRLVLDREPEELEELLEELYEEAGLTAAVQLVERRADRPDSPYYGCRIVCPLPCVVLDYSREPHLITADVARGSLWLDMDSLEAKRRRIEDRDTGILYFSMKKEWKRAART